ncbi:conserved hypothetical protein [Desulfamplus magnetovallimortis]|uniref:DUF4276 family protein n=1 Tax=Desulfamplus magnetovallimortis TaxID=1246637 RepID=A0A1W1HHK5_9BACT|nr:DUF4276 family protein [Desulfamplus magnetovallimortis]SLM31930.1 conserved hypothetical protein [Desulfamplus magnetovallimortis]
MLEKLIVFVEEYSMESALEILLPKMLGEVQFQIICFQCKDDLLKQLPNRLRGYSWIPDEWSIIVLVDRDDDACETLKQQLEQNALEAGFTTKTSAATGQRFKVTNRIVIEELEAWYFGDWNAVRTAYPRVPATIPNKAPYRDPDGIPGGTWEALERVLKRAGYFLTGLRKSECAKEIAQHMDVNQNVSHSFNMFQNAVQPILSGSVA